jgi:alpha 1,3-glucosidase
MYREGSLGHYFIKDQDRDYVAECWPGQSSWPNFLDGKAREWWASKFALSAEMPANVHIWNDMNEPAVFGATSCEGTFPKHLLHKSSDGIEHEDREVHNLYGLLNAAGTYLGLLKRTGGVFRPFLLTRSFFSGTQKFAWTWSGDNAARWSDLRVSIASLVTSGLGGIPFTGTDVGGFFGNSTEELLVRWYQAGAWCYPFFREHANIESAFREPYLLRTAAMSIIRNAIRDRYKMLPMWYTAVRNANLTGEPVVQPLWMEFQQIPLFHASETLVLVANALLVAPVAAPVPATVEIVKPPGRWFRFSDGIELAASVNVTVLLDEIPVFIRGGKIVPAYTKAALSTKEILATPITLHVALDEHGRANGTLYLDDGETHRFMDGEYLLKRFYFANGVLSSKTAGRSVPQGLVGMRIDRVVIYNQIKRVWWVNVALTDEFVIRGESGPETSYRWELVEFMLVVIIVVIVATACRIVRRRVAQRNQTKYV